MSEFYLHPFGNVDVVCPRGYDKMYYERWCRESREALHAHPERVDDPGVAKYGVASATLRCLSFTKVRWSALSQNIATLVSRIPGKKYVVFDFSDNPQPLFQSGSSIVCKSAFSQQYYCVTNSVAMPQFPRHEFDRLPSLASQRQVLASFKGGVPDDPNHVRSRLLMLNNDKDCIVMKAKVTPEHFRFLPSGRSTENTPSGEVSYEELLFSSIFALVPRGLGYSIGYRLIESMNAGCIPVILADDHVLPFSEVIDYDDWSINVCERDVMKVPDLLRERLDEVDRLQQNVRRVFSDYFASTQKIIQATLAMASRRVN